MRHTGNYTTRHAVSDYDLNRYSVSVWSRLRRRLRAAFARSVYTIGRKLLSWSRSHYGERNSFLPDSLQVEIERCRVWQEFDSHINLYNAWADHFNLRLGLYHGDIFQDGICKDAVHVRVADDGQGFLVQRQALSPEQMQRGLELSMEAIDLAICRYYLADVEEGLEEKAVENAIKKIVAE